MRWTDSVYLAARYVRREELAGYAVELRAAGIDVTSSWLTGAHGQDDGNREQWALYAEDDYNDLLDADTVVVFSEDPGVPNASRGGRHVELGLALGFGKNVVLVGPVENVFMALPIIDRVDTWAEAKDLLLNEGVA